MDTIKRPKHKRGDIILIKGADEQFEIKRAYFDGEWFYSLEDNYDETIQHNDILANLTTKKWYSIIKKEEVIKFTTESEEYKISVSLYREMIKVNPMYKPPDFQKWAVEVGRMMRLDKRPPVMIKELIRLIFEDNFWRGQIQSTGKLREKFDSLVTRFAAQMQAKGEKKEKKKALYL